MNFDTGITALYPRKTNLDFLEKLDENIRSEIEVDLRLHQPTHKPFGIRLKIIFIMLPGMKEKLKSMKFILSIFILN